MVAIAIGESCAAPQPESQAQQAQGETAATRLVIAPATATLAVGDSLRLQAIEVIGRSDSVAATGIEWRSANRSIATVSSQGVVEALGEGLTGISAVMGDRVTVARVIVVARAGAAPRIAQATPPAAPPDDAVPTRDPAPRVRQPADRAPAPTSSAPPRRDASGRNPEMPNEPPGYTQITDRHFIAKAANREDTGPEGSDGWTGGEFRYRNFSIVEDPTAPTGDGRVGQMLYRANHRAGTGPASVRRQLPPNLHEVYISVWAKLSPNWVGNQASINKIFFFGVAGGNNQFIFTAYGSGRNRLEARMSLQGVLDPRSFLRPNLRPAYVERGQWQRWEFVLRCNSGLNVADGTADLWLNGVHVTSAKNINWTQTKHPTRPCNMNMMNWNPTYGGGGASPGVEQWLRFDRVYISGR